MDKQKDRHPGEPLDDSVLEAVSGGASLYEGADGMDRDSWFASLILRMMPGKQPPQGPGPQINNGPLTPFVIGEYSKRR